MLSNQDHMLKNEQNKNGIQKNFMNQPAIAHKAGYSAPATVVASISPSAVRYALAWKVGANGKSE